jgi:hypothetical protein
MPFRDVPRGALGSSTAQPGERRPRIDGRVASSRAP